jgi:SEC-C motif
MPIVPAFCDNCGTPFPSGFNFENSFHISLSGVTSSPCPKCGGIGHVPDGLFNFVGNTIEILSAPGRTHAEYERLASIVQEGKSQKLEKDEISERIKSEAPAFGALVDILPSNKNELYGFLAVVIAVLALIKPSDQPQQAPININVEKVIQQCYKQSKDTMQQPRSKVGRNDPCPCASGKKYKHCCGSAN